VGFELVIPAIEQPQKYALDSTTAGARSLYSIHQ